MMTEPTWDVDAYPYNPDAQEGDPDYRPGPDWPPSLDEIAHVHGMTTEKLMDEVRHRLATSWEDVFQPSLDPSLYTCPDCGGDARSVRTSFKSPGGTFAECWNEHIWGIV